MDRQEIIDALWSLARDRESFFTDDDYGHDDLFRRDYAALMAAIEIIEEERQMTRKEILDCVRYAPEVDAVPVVRCRDCKFRNTSWYDKRDMFESFCRWDRDESPNDDDYCSYGVKIEDKQ